MYLAEKTTASPAGIWAIVIVAVVCLAFWLVMVVGIAPRPDARQRRGQQSLRVPLAGGDQVPVSGAPVTETRDDLHPLPSPRSTGEPGVQRTARAPAQREPATDQAVPHRDRDG